MHLRRLSGSKLCYSAYSGEMIVAFVEIRTRFHRASFVQNSEAESGSFRTREQGSKDSILNFNPISPDPGQATSASTNT